MRPVLLDTNVVSELRKSKNRINPQVLSWAQGLDIENSYLSVITLYELERGILLLQKKDPRQSAGLADWLDAVTGNEFKGRILPISASIARRAAALQAEDPRPVPDAFIAATARDHNMALATRNIQDFLKTGIEALNPWEEGSPSVMLA
ncbi:MAG: type II toxin-antitoxin system VapC family toxin [Eggerthellaceae bacterium]|jgi:predicted nucleic acid-binding protein|nr:type II toxin-antitoxin system VapC family toxin [Eggerthellaceae bacterium]MDR2715697.1 type II toxin-antitoxin system VapC family toxin [Coriobacteriaceae bacterium]